MMTEALVPHWLRAGHEVMIGGRTPAKAEELAHRLDARAGTLREAAEFGEVVFLAVLHAGVQPTLRDAGAANGVLRGKVLIESTNAIDERMMVTTGPGTSISEQIAAVTQARVAKAFNQVHAEVWSRAARYAGEPQLVPIAGDPDAKLIVSRLIRDAGGEPLDAGALEHAHELEAMAAVVIRLLVGGADPLSAFQFVVGSANAREQPMPCSELEQRCAAHRPKRGDRVRDRR
jgi:predicted dinucleotide-binding enzyme